MNIKNIYITICLMLFTLSTAAQDYKKMSGMVREMVVSAEGYKVKGYKVKGYNVGGQRLTTVFVRCKDTDVLRERGCQILASWDDIHIVTVPVRNIAALSEHNAVKRIEAGKPCNTTVDRTAQVVKVSNVWQQNINETSLTGNGVVMGVMDIGFDLTHPTFFSKDMSRYRIRSIWDQLDFSTAGQPYETADTTYVGRIYTTESEILTKAFSADADFCTHGTHTAAIAAGSGAEGNATTSPYCGMAPDADICLVSNLVADNMHLVSEDSIDLYTTATDMLGFKYIFDYAEAQGKPCVINFSEGAPETLYDSQLYNEVLEKMTGPGRIICAAAGNEAWKQTYIQKKRGVERAGAFLTGSEKTVFHIMRSEKPVTMTLTFYNTDGTNISRTYDTTELSQNVDSILIDSVDVSGDRFTVMMAAYPSCYDSTQWATELLVTDTLRYINNTVTPVSVTLSGADNEIEMFAKVGYFTQNSKNPLLNNFSNTHNILFPASAPDIICVGGTGYTTQHTNIYGETMVSNVAERGNRMSYSSIGPSLSELTKPDVVAPGQNIISAYSSRYYEKNPAAADIRWSVKEFSHNGRKYLWTSNSGTSMAAPVVAGIVALWLQECPTLSPEQLRDVIANTANKIHSSMTYPNNEYGHGEINAEDGLQYIRKTYTGIQNITTTDTHNNNIYDLYGRKLTSIPKNTIVIINGKKRINW